MVHLYPFQAVHPKKEKAQDIAAVPYDVINATEAAEIIRKQPLSFLNISRSDATLSCDPYDAKVYATAQERFAQYMHDGLLIKDQLPSLYIYRVTTQMRKYTGLCGCFDLLEYQNDTIRKHELTRVEKEQDRTRHIDAVNANTGPVIFLHEKNHIIRSLLTEYIQIIKTPSICVTAPDGSIHEIFPFSNQEQIHSFVQEFSNIKHLYIADGHHRCKSALNVLEQRAANVDITTVPEDTKRVMGVAFAEDEVIVYGYHRLILTLHHTTSETFMNMLKEIATVTPYPSLDPSVSQIKTKQDVATSHILHLYYNKTWYEIAIPKKSVLNPVDALDVTVLQTCILEPFLHITNPRTDPALQYVGGSSPVSVLMEAVDRGEAVFAIAMQPVSVTDVFAIADSGGIMPPKSTWFEPKMLSGLTTHLLS
ncbi:MAG: DUF1015 domain-containing protein [Methanomicrobiales archaeon]|jgi:uncharacterized protein (DUF1015 family)|nr:DUF1015 domain-containing protein [Methanomicrobiales archaeon]